MGSSLTREEQAALVMCRERIRNARVKLKEAAAELDSAESRLAALDSTAFLASSANWERGLLWSMGRTVTALRSELNRLSSRLGGWL